jgi:TusE/DsrC/DsvC family sulfur relay protein
MSNIPEPAAQAHLPATDDEGYLIDPSDWNEAVAEELARREGVALTALHWQVLHFMRRFHEEHQVTADARFVIRFLAEEQALGESARKRLFEMFPYGYVKQACKIAGMRRPRAWSTG